MRTILAIYATVMYLFIVFAVYNICKLKFTNKKIIYTITILMTFVCIAEYILVIKTLVEGVTSL